MVSIKQSKKNPRSPDREIVRKLPKFVPLSDMSHFKHFWEDFSVRWTRIFFPIAGLRPWFKYAYFEYKEAYFSDNLNFDL